MSSYSRIAELLGTGVRTMLTFTMDEAERIALAMNEAVLLTTYEKTESNEGSQQLTIEVFKFIESQTIVLKDVAGRDGTHLASAKHMTAEMRDEFARRYFAFILEALQESSS